MDPRELRDPFKLKQVLWPDVYFTREQRLIIESVFDNDETYVAAGNMQGKDFVAGFVIPTFFLTRHPCRIVTTSAKDDHLRVLWGEIGRFIQMSKHPLSSLEGGPLILRQRSIGKMYDGRQCPLSYIVGLVAAEDSIAAMQGHHVANTGDGIPRTMFVSDESSSVQDDYYRMASTWANRMYIFGNPWPCENFFRRGVDGGDIPTDDGKRFHRKVIRIRAEDSPNVRLAQLQQAAGEEPTGETIVPGVLGWEEYKKRRKLWDEVQQCVSLDAEFYTGKELKLFPPAHLVRCIEYGRRIATQKRSAEAVGVDPGEGIANTSVAAADGQGVFAIESRKTKDTSEIVPFVMDFCRRHGLGDRWENCLFDLGGGGRQIADNMRLSGFNVRTVAFGGAVQAELRRGHQVYRPWKERLGLSEDRYVYTSRRAQMYGELSILCDPNGGIGEYGGSLGWTMPHHGTAAVELRRQLSMMPRLTDREGRMRMLPKNKVVVSSKEKSLVEILGCSPDEADATVLATHGLLHKQYRAKAGVG